MRNRPGLWTTDDLPGRAASLRTLARSLVLDESRAEDLVQDTLVVALERPPRTAGSLSGWLATVARRLALDRVRGERRRVAREEQVAREEAVESPVRALEGLELEREVLDAVLALREPYRTVVYLRYWEELGPAAIASKLDVPLKTVKSRLFRALEDLRTRLDSRCDGGRDRWVSALLPIAFPRGSAASGSGLGSATGIAGGAWIVKKALVAVAAMLLLVLAWRAVDVWKEGGGPPLAAAGTTDPEVLPPKVAGVLAGAAVEAPPGTAARSVVSETALESLSATTGSLLIRLVRHDGLPAADVSIDVRCWDDPAPREEFFRRRTDREGRVLIPDLFAGKVDVYTDRGAQFQVEVAAGKRREIDLVLPQGFAVEGRVVGPGGEAVPGAELWIEGIRRASPRAHLAARAGADGSFRLDELGEDAEISARARGFVASYTFEVWMLPLGPSGTREVVIELGPAGGRVGGRVLDPSGRPVAGALVKIGASGGGIVDLPSGLRATFTDPVPVETDAQGRFTYAGDLPEVVQLVSVSARGWPAWQGEVEVRAGERRELEIVLSEPAAIEGRVVDPSGAPIAGARVVASVEHSGGWYHDPFPPPRAETDAGGRFRLGWIAPGDQELNASVRGKPELGRAKLSVKCAAGETASAELRLDTGLNINGKVVDTEGRPLAGWRVYAHSQSSMLGNAHPRQGKSDELGRYLVANLDGEHRYQLRAHAPGKLSVHARVEISGIAPGARDVDLVVADVSEPDARVRGRLVGPDGRVPTDLRIVYWLEGDTRGGFIEFDLKTGAFDQGSLLAGRYALRVSRGGQTIHQTEAFDLRAGETKDVGTLVPGSPGRLEIVFVGVSEADLATMDPFLNREGHSTEYLTLEGGVLRSRMVAPGKWKLGLSGGWFLRASDVEVRPDETTRVEVKPERGYEVRIACVFADSDAVWASLTAKASDQRGEAVQPGLVWFRSAVQDGKMRLHGLALPAGRMLVEATTDTGLKGSEWVEVGPGSADSGEREIVVR